MGTITLTKTRECADGTHWTIEVTGSATGKLYVLSTDLTEPVTEDEKRAFFKVLVRLARIGRTNTQIKNALNAGYTLTI